MTLIAEHPPLFVYGSLKRGGRHHGELKGAVCVGACRTAARYQLVVLQGYPALSPGGDKAIAGELYAVDERLLADLDQFEGEHYLRGLVDLEDGRVAEAYLLAKPGRSDVMPLDGDTWPVW